MLLMKLQTREKFAFLQLSHYLARADGHYGEAEENIIEEYCAEMGIENSNGFSNDDFDLLVTLNEFKSKKSKKIVLLESMILIHIDNRLDLSEIDLISEIIKVFKFDANEVKHFSSWGKAVSALYEQGILLIEE
ncbi:MAG: TerB family tellurite resistance protein [Campylobacteraceae bacterium]|nr:TerB family tellurite resistance protein [Campylobacteraceae bacterium]